MAKKQKFVHPSFLSAVYCTLQFEGIHNWPNCPIEEVSYLRFPHRHMFHIKAWMVVSHSDRDVEFIWLKHRITEYLDKTYPDHQLGAKSCEMLAEELINKFGLAACEVNEDGENGAIVIKDPT
jgi:hypothetical protein